MYGKRAYGAPELHLPCMTCESGNTANLPAQDMWALGACLLKLLTGELVCHDLLLLRYPLNPCSRLRA